MKGRAFDVVGEGRKDASLKVNLKPATMLALFSSMLPIVALAQDNQPYTLKTQSNVVLVPTTVQTKHGEMLYALKPEQFVVEDNGVPQAIHLDEDTDSLGLSLVVAVQCSRAAVMEFAKLRGLAAMVDSIAGDAPREVAIVSYGSQPQLLGKLSSAP